MRQKNVKQVNGQWPISKSDIKLGVELGRKLQETMMAFAVEHGELHIKVMSVAVQYMMDLHDEKMHAISDDVLFAHDIMEKYGLGDLINEPFVSALVEQEKEVEAALENEAAPAEEQGTPEAPAEEAVPEEQVEQSAEELSAEQKVQGGVN